MMRIKQPTQARAWFGELAFFIVEPIPARADLLFDYSSAPPDWRSHLDGGGGGGGIR